MSQTHDIVQSPEYWAEAKAHLRAHDPIMDALISRYEQPALVTKRRLFETLALFGRRPADFGCGGSGCVAAFFGIG